MPISSQAAGTLTLSALLTIEMNVVIQNKEDVKYHVKAYWKAYGQDPSDADIKDHIEHIAHLDGIRWLKPFEVFNANELSFKRLRWWIQPTQENKVGWIYTWWVPLSDQEAVNATIITVFRPSDWSILLVDPKKDMHHLWRVLCVFFMSVYSPG